MARRYGGSCPVVSIAIEKKLGLELLPRDLRPDREIARTACASTRMRPLRRGETPGVAFLPRNHSGRSEKASERSQAIDQGEGPAPFARNEREEISGRTQEAEQIGLRRLLLL